ncbi:hypothetical protein [Neisseria iguanae]|uniref:Uncharacterized protein n=1 Tax=Neisseria iguanae TaxID=90242 RepID=A0A2P7U2J7_9NEIS|nr:hypothetical protein [Neisseria iguanae]PSJ81198.1 hypothetical protein C7N83_01885 [Neisseria iguanae]
MDKTVSLAEFMEQEKGLSRTSRLEPWHDEILTLKRNGYTQAQILKFLSLNGVQISQTALNAFIRNRMRALRVSEAPTITRVMDNGETAVNMSSVMREDTDMTADEERIDRLRNVRVGKRKFQSAQDIDVNDLT